MNVFIIVFLIIVRSSLAFLPDPDNCCKIVKIKTSGTYLHDGDIYKLKKDLYLENEIESSTIYYYVEDEEWHWHISWHWRTELFSNSSQKCPENVKDWFKWNGYPHDDENIVSANANILCHTP